jgi:hypothetical protein
MSKYRRGNADEAVLMIFSICSLVLAAGLAIVFYLT